jgi:hypothetical protein
VVTNDLPACSPLAPVVVAVFIGSRQWMGGGRPQAPGASTRRRPQHGSVGGDDTMDWHEEKPCARDGVRTRSRETRGPGRCEAGSTVDVVYRGSRRARSAKARHSSTAISNSKHQPSKN